MEMHLSQAIIERDWEEFLMVINLEAFDGMRARR
jgi:hypothetical protein